MTRTEELLAAIAEERKGKCEAIVSGSTRSRKGGGRVDDCDRLAVYHVESRLSGYTTNVCRQHVLRFRRDVERDKLIGRTPYYTIAELPR